MSDARRFRRCALGLGDPSEGLRRLAHVKQGHRLAGQVLHQQVAAAGSAQDGAAIDLGHGAVEVLDDDNFARWARFRAIHKPVIAAVSGYALGGGCELALMCDLVVASETAQFGQPEVKIGIIPGAGGTQRWARSAGKVRAMEAVITGEPVGAVDAERIGLVNRVVPAGAHLDEALRLANLIAARPPLAVRLGKEAVNQAMEVPLSAGLEFERKLFYLLFASDDKREGMRAFIEKRAGRFTGR